MEKEKAMKILQRVLELQNKEFYYKGIHNEKGERVPERVADANEYHKINEDLGKAYGSLKKGDKVLIILDKDRFKRQPRMSRKQRMNMLFDKTAPRTQYEIAEAIIDQPIKTRIKKDQFVGDGYEDVEVTTFKYINGGYIVTDQFPMSKYMIKI